MTAAVICPVCRTNVLSEIRQPSFSSSAGELLAYRCKNGHLFLSSWSDELDQKKDRNDSNAA
jgi:hypothetical protein